MIFSLDIDIFIRRLGAGLKKCIGKDIDYDEFTGMGLRNRID